MADRKPFLLRLDPATFDALQRWANDEFRSLNGQVEYLLTRALREGQGLTGSRTGGGPRRGGRLRRLEAAERSGPRDIAMEAGTDVRAHTSWCIIGATAGGRAVGQRPWACSPRSSGPRERRHRRGASRAAPATHVRVACVASSWPCGDRRDRAGAGDRTAGEGVAGATPLPRTRLLRRAAGASARAALRGSRTAAGRGREAATRTRATCSSTTTVTGLPSTPSRKPMRQPQASRACVNPFNMT